MMYVIIACTDGNKGVACVAADDTCSDGLFAIRVHGGSTSIGFTHTQSIGPLGGCVFHLDTVHGRSTASRLRQTSVTVCREALQALVSPTDAQLALCSAGAYGEKEGEGALRDTLPAQLELEKLSKKWNVPTG